MRLSGLPTSTLALLLLGTSRSSWPPFQLPLDLRPAGMPGCSLLASGEWLFPTTSSQGVAQVQLSIPADPDLLGVPFFQQALVADPAANPFGATLSNGGQGTIGGR